MEAPWNSLFSNVEMELNIDNNEDLFLEEVLQQFVMSSETGRPNNLLNINSTGTEELLAIAESSQPLRASRDNDRAQGGRKKTKSYLECLGHAEAERKRRLELSQGFIALSAIIPGLKKIDKASVLKEATSYVKQLQKRVKEMEEEENAKKIIVESVSVLNDRHKVEARVLENQVLIQIHCDGSHHHILLKTLFSHITALHLSIVSHAVLPFGKLSLHITIIAQMGENYKMALNDLVRSLRRELFLE